MATKLYVGNLSFKTTSDELREHFAQAGNVESASVVEDRMTGRSRGFGFVEMTTAQEAAVAISQLNGQEFNGHQLAVKEELEACELCGRMMQLKRGRFGPFYGCSGYPECKNIRKVPTTPRRLVGRLIRRKLVPVVEERIINGPEPIERTAYLRSEPIAVAYLDKTEATLAWPLSDEASLEVVLDAYLTDFLPRYMKGLPNNVLEFWIENDYYESHVGTFPTTELVLQEIKKAALRSTGSLRLLQIGSDETLIEILFDDNTPPRPIRLAVLISVVRVEPLARLFGRFHRNATVRGNAYVAQQLFDPTIQTVHGNSTRLLSPLRTDSQEPYSFRYKQSEVGASSFAMEE